MSHFVWWLWFIYIIKMTNLIASLFGWKLIYYTKICRCTFSLLKKSTCKINCSQDIGNNKSKSGNLVEKYNFTRENKTSVTTFHVTVFYVVKFHFSTSVMTFYVMTFCSQTRVIKVTSSFCFDMQYTLCLSATNSKRYLMYIWFYIYKKSISIN